MIYYVMMMTVVVDELLISLFISLVFCMITRSFPYLAVETVSGETTALIPPNTMVESKEVVNHVDFNEAQVSSDDVIQVQRSFHGIQSGLLAGHDGYRYYSLIHSFFYPPVYSPVVVI